MFDVKKKETIVFYSSIHTIYILLELCNNFILSLLLCVLYSGSTRILANRHKKEQPHDKSHKVDAKMLFFLKYISQP